ncbi:MAG: hypothetical protein ACTSPY_13825 [Candidatus Helarchaeota archaeon]
MSVVKIKKFEALTYEQIKLNVLANLFRMLIDIYGSEKSKKGLKKIEGEEIYVDFPDLDGGIIFKPYNGRVFGNAAFGLKDSEKPKIRLNFKVKDDKIYETLEKIIKSKPNTWSILKIFFKHILIGRIRISPLSKMGIVSTLFKSLMIGDHPMYKDVDIKKMGRDEVEK